MTLARFLADRRNRGVVCCGRRERGFTLIELTISSSIAVAVLGVSYLCLRAGLSVQSGIEKRAELAQTARVVLDRMAADLRSAWTLSKDLDFVGVDGVSDGTETDRILFGSRNWQPRAAGQGDFCQVSYALTKPEGEESFQLVRTRNPFPDDNPFAPGEPEVLAEGLKGLHLEYYDGLYWYDKWGRVPGLQLDTTADLLSRNTSGLPDAVRIVLSFPDPEPPRKGEEADDELPAAEEEAVETELPGAVPALAGPAGGGGGRPIATPYRFEIIVGLHLATQARDTATSSAMSGSTGTSNGATDSEGSPSSGGSRG